MTTPAASLSQDDIDRLLGGRPAVVPTSRGDDVQLYDFRRPARVSRDRLRTLEAMYERLVRSFEGWLVARLRDTVDLRLQSVEQISYAEFLLSLNTPCASYLVGIADVGQQQGVVDFSPSLSYYLVDRLFGGAGEPTILDRALSPIERMALGTVAERIVNDVSAVWAEHVPLTLEVAGFESIPEIMQAVEREVPVLVATLNARFAGGTGVLAICLPLNVVEAFFSRATERRLGESVGSATERSHTREQTESAIRRTTVAVTARLPEFRMPMRDLLRLTAGTTIATGIPVDGPLQLFVGDQPRFLVAAGRVRQQRAVSVLDVLAGPDLETLLPSFRGRAAMESRPMSSNQSDVDALFAGGGAPSDATAEPQPPELSDLGAALLAGGEVPFAALIDITLPVRIEVGRTSLTVGELLKLGRGSVLQLDRLAGEPMDLFVSDLRLAEGEVVVVNEHYGFRLRRIVAQLPAQAFSA